VEEIDDALNFMGNKAQVASKLLPVKNNWGTVDNLFRKLFTRFSSVEGKWFVRLTRRDLFPVMLPCEYRQSTDIGKF
jgi:hypothetical protein